MMFCDVWEKDEQCLEQALTDSVHFGIFKMAESTAGHTSSQGAHALYQRPNVI